MPRDDIYINFAAQMFEVAEEAVTAEQRRAAKMAAFAFTYSPPMELADDAINPPHYQRHPSGVECIEITEHMNFNLGSAIQYIWRSDEKGGIEDLRKAVWHLNREIQRLLLSKPKTPDDHPYWVSEDWIQKGGSWASTEGSAYPTESVSEEHKAWVQKVAGATLDDDPVDPEFTDEEIEEALEDWDNPREHPASGEDT